MVDDLLEELLQDVLGNDEYAKEEARQEYMEICRNNSDV